MYLVEVEDRGVVTYVLPCDILVTKFEQQLHYYIHFQTNTLWKIIKPLILPAIS